MSDLHSLIRRSIIDRGLTSAEARQEVYQQARTAIIRELWSYDPPLAEDEIDARVGQFDLAIGQLEDDLADTFAAEDEEPPGATAATPPARRPAPVFEGYDHETDYVPAYVAPDGPARLRRQQGARGGLPATRDAGRARSGEILDPLALRSAAIEAALRGGNETGAPEDDPEAEAIQTESEVEAAAFEEESPVEEVDDHPSGWSWDDDQSGPNHYIGEDPDYRGETEEADIPQDGVAQGRARRRRAPPAWTAVLPRLADLDERMRVRFLIGAIAGLGLVFLVLAGFILSSFFSGSGRAPELAAAAAPTAETGAAAKPSRADAAPSDAAQSFSVFDGTDPTVFESGPGNPVRFDKAGSFARISSSSSDPGARVIIGPGIATRLSGRNVRLSLVARAASDNGAAGLRFAYENGLAISPWQTANLTNQFQSYNLTWRVPAMRADPNADQILIEPGIPGDGTAADVQSIRIDVLSE